MTDFQKERFTMAPVALFEYVRDKRITPTAYALWHLLWSYSDSENRECWPSRATLAEQLGLKRVANVDKYITQLVDAGLVVKFGRSDGSQQLSNGYRMSWGSAENGTGGSAENGTGVVPERAHEQEPVNNNQLTRTTISPKPSVSERVIVKGDSSVTVSEESGVDDVHHGEQGCTSVPPNPVLNPGKNPGTISSNPTGSKRVSEKDNDKMFSNDEVILEDDHPVLMPEDWNYNETHMALMDQKLPGHDHDLVATAFAYEFDGFHSSNWDRKFSWWINHVATNEHAMSRFEETLDTFADIDPPAAIEDV